MKDRLKKGTAGDPNLVNGGMDFFQNENTLSLNFNLKAERKKEGRKK